MLQLQRLSAQARRSPRKAKWTRPGTPPVFSLGYTIRHATSIAASVRGLLPTRHSDTLNPNKRIPGSMEGCKPGCFLTKTALEGRDTNGRPKMASPLSIAPPSPLESAAILPVRSLPRGAKAILEGHKLLRSGWGCSSGPPHTSNDAKTLQTRLASLWIHPSA